MPMRAAQYVRMSTDHQQYSTTNQKVGIAAYAAARDVEIVATYEDAGKSGLTLSGRPALRQLLADVAAGQDLFELVLVYDVSRWGRFQDADESAHLEYLCRLSGVSVEYCAEPFSNDGTPFASICKVVKRALAAEYSRELSNKVYIGKRRLIELGFWQAGCPGYGLRRCLVDASGARKQLLAYGERKSIATDRTILVPGPPEEVAVVQRIYKDYIGGMGCWSLAHALNRDGVRSENGARWSEATVKRVLTLEKYVGDSVWGRTSAKLKTPHQHTDPSTWARCPSAFEGVVSRELFNKAQKVRAKRRRRASDGEIVQRLRSIHSKHGEITVRRIREDGCLGAGVIRQRFGSLARAYDEVGFRPSRDLGLISSDGAARRLLAKIGTAVADGIEAQGGSVERLRGRCRFLINGEITASVSAARRVHRDRGTVRWFIKQGGTDDDLTIVVIMDGKEERPVCFYFFPAAAIGGGLLVGPNNPAPVEVFRSSALDPLWRLFARCDPASAWCPPPAKGRRRRENPSPVRPLDFKLGRSRSATRKAGAGAFVKTTRDLRAAAAKADLTAAHVSALRQTLGKLVVDARFVRVLSQQEISSVPRPLFCTERECDAPRRAFQEDLRDRATALISGNRLSAKARLLFEKLTLERRIEAAEVMVLTNDITDCHALSLVVGTPDHELMEGFRYRANGPRRRLRRRLIEEGAYNYREAKRALSASGFDTLDSVVLCAFVRRLMANPDVSAWLEKNNRKAAAVLTSALRDGLDRAATN